MSKTSYILLLLFLLCVGGFFFTKNYFPVTAKLPTLTENAETSDTIAHGTLSLSPKLQTLIPGQTSTVDIFLETQNATPVVLQFEIAYDPANVTPLQIIPGKAFNGPIVLLNDINPRNGRISYALKCDADCEKNPAEKVAQMSFTVNPFALVKETSFKVMPKTLLETKEESNVVLNTTNAKVIIRGVVAPQATPSAQIAQ